MRQYSTWCMWTDLDRPDLVMLPARVAKPHDGWASVGQGGLPGLYLSGPRAPMVVAMPAVMRHIVDAGMTRCAPLTGVA